MKYVYESLSVIIIISTIFMLGLHQTEQETTHEEHTYSNIEEALKQLETEEKLVTQIQGKENIAGLAMERPQGRPDPTISTLVQKTSPSTITSDCYTDSISSGGTRYTQTLCINSDGCRILVTSEYTTQGGYSEVYSSITRSCPCGDDCVSIESVQTSEVKEITLT